MPREIDGFESYPTTYGRGMLEWRRGVLSAHYLPGTKRAQAVSPGSVVAASRSPAARLLERYFAGERVTFPADMPIDRAWWSPFAAAVAAALAAVPYGTTITYAELAAAAGHPGAQRAAGSFLARNPLPVILPCHRVVRADGAAGSYSWGERWKLRLLELEGCGGGLR